MDYLRAEEGNKPFNAICLCLLTYFINNEENTLHRSQNIVNNDNAVLFSG